MARLRRVWGPKLSTDKVSIVHEMGRKYKHAKILVTIRLDPTRLKVYQEAHQTVQKWRIQMKQPTKRFECRDIATDVFWIIRNSNTKNNDAGEDISDSEISSMDNELMDF